jgi:Zn-dependent M28 family amino/carboxypeptidase
MDTEEAVSFRPRFWTRGRKCFYGGLALAFVIASMGGYFTMIRMPGESYSGVFAPLDALEDRLEKELRRDVATLAGDIGERNALRERGLYDAADFVDRSLKDAGYEVRREAFDANGTRCENIEAQIVGRDRAAEVVVVGAHYDSVQGTVGANDNGSGAAAVLALARAFAGRETSRTLRFVEFANEEPPHFQTSTMGSLVYAKGCRERGDRVVAMLSIETIGYYRDEDGTQSYPFPFSLFYPSTGNFVGFVGNSSSCRLVRQSIETFRKTTRFPSEGAAVPGSLPGIGWSDHWAFWEQGYPGVMVTDTALFRYPHYHTTRDTPDKLHYDRMARVVAGLEEVVAELAGRR